MSHLIPELLKANGLGSITLVDGSVMTVAITTLIYVLRTSGSALQVSCTLS